MGWLNSNSSAGRVARGLLLAVGAMPTLVGCADASRQPSSDSVLLDVLRELKRTNEALVRIEARLDRPSVEQSAPARAQVVPSDSATAEQVRTLVNELVQQLDVTFGEQLRALLDALPFAAKSVEVVPRQEHIAKKSEAVQAAIQRFLENPDAERARHFTMNPADVYATYGTPDEVEVGPLQTWWAYRLGEEGGISFYFPRTQNVVGIHEVWRKP
jgi:hypothetical protein